MRCAIHKNYGYKLVQHNVIHASLFIPDFNTKSMLYKTNILDKIPGLDSNG